MSISDLFSPTSSFNGVGFWYSPEQPGVLTRRGKTAVYDRQWIPYSSNAIIQSGGTDTPPTTFTVLIATANLGALEAKVGTVGTLALVGNGSRTAYLANTQQGKQYLPDYTTVQLTFEY